MYPDGIETERKQILECTTIHPSVAREDTVERAPSSPHRPAVYFFQCPIISSGPHLGITVELLQHTEPLRRAHNHKQLDRGRA